ncbi:PP2C family protein-serine/threonine phosphatase [Actinoplanes sp. G11-F43]|uniref:PP2C family protein-serine/threonine phosphatase n=1 Tax=Actinoplanes sp. G11-F43 TaxID=3424130 RepID=UPI003D32661F
METRTAEWVVAGRRLSAVAGSVVGNRYRANFDVLHLDDEIPLAVVADGMGDGPGSTAAGRTAVETFVREASGDTPAVLRNAVAEVQKAVREAGRRIPDLTGCTLAALVADSGRGMTTTGRVVDEAAAWIVQLGDSRVYRMRAGCFELLTTDHTAAWLGVLNGWYAPGSREAYRDRHRLTRYAGHPAMPEPDLLNISLRPEDLLLICTDGVSDQVDDRALEQLLTGEPDPAGAVERLLTLTLDKGGDDNATAVIIAVR